MESVYKCPVCSAQLQKVKKQLICKNNHSFDQAKQGYFNLLLGNKSKDKISGDSKEMLDARNQILNSGFYDTVSDGINEIVADFITSHQIKDILDIGAGTGFYLNRLRKSINDKEINCYGIDIAKDGVKEASKKGKTVQYIVGNNSNLPYLDNEFDIVMSVFSPLFIEEAKRVMKDKGILLVISPNQGHLIEMKEIIYDTIIEKKLDRNEIIDDCYVKIRKVDVATPLSLDKNMINSLFLMTPHYWTSSMEGKNRLKDLDNLNTHIDITIEAYEYKKNS